MRHGTHPGKASGRLDTYGHHRVVIPVHIPNFEGYYAESREVLRRCLDSLRETAQGQVAVTLVSDGSCAAVAEDLHERMNEGWVDQVIVNRPNRGKVDTVVGVARASYEELVTIADADVLFRHGWVDAVESLFLAFPECGFASLFPSPAGCFYNTSTTLIGGLLRRELRLASVVEECDLDRFSESIGRPDLYSPTQRKVQLVMTRGSVTACVGAPHFVCTLRRAVIRGIPPEPSLQAINNAELRWLDEPPDRLGYWRLSTSRAFAQHMGNVPEPWMDDELDATRSGTRLDVRSRPYPSAGHASLVGRLPWRARQAFVARLQRPWLERRIRRAAGVD